MKLNLLNAIIFMMPSFVAFAETITCPASITCSNGSCDYPVGWINPIDKEWTDNADGFYYLEEVFVMTAGDHKDESGAEYNEKIGYLRCQYKPSGPYANVQAETDKIKYKKPIISSSDESMWSPEKDDQGHSLRNGSRSCYETISNSADIPKCKVEVFP